MAYLVKNARDFRVIKMNHSEILETFTGSLCICDSCGRPSTIKTGMGGYYIAVLNSVYCEKCYEEWVQVARNHPEDRGIELKNFTFAYKKNNVIEEPFFFDDEFIDEINTEFIDRILGFSNISEISEIQNLSDDFQIKLTGADIEPVFVFSENYIIEGIDDERFPEDSEKTVEKIRKVLSDNIDFKKINELMPTLYYGNSTRKFYLTKKELLNYV